MDIPFASRRATPADVEFVTTIIELAFANDPPALIPGAMVGL